MEKYPILLNETSVSFRSIGIMRSKNKELYRIIEGFIDNYMTENNRSPSYREIATAVGISSASVSRYLKSMKEDGLIEYSGQRNIMTKENRKVKDQSIKVPLLGKVACGIPKLANENIEAFVRLPMAIFGRGDYFLLHADGDSMIDVGINNGDLILVRKQNYATPGQIIVALIDDDEATLKRYYPEADKRRVRLHPENKNMKDIYVSKCIIQGVAIKVFKNIE